MKKIVIIFIAAISCIMMLFVGCGKEPETQQPIDLANCEIGYELPIYPNYEFTYIVAKDNKEYTINVDSIKATLIEKNTIPEDGEIKGAFYLYTVKIEATAHTNTIFVGQKFDINITFSSFDPKTVFSLSTTVNADGTLYWEDYRHINSYGQMIFEYID